MKGHQLLRLVPGRNDIKLNWSVTPFFGLVRHKSVETAIEAWAKGKPILVGPRQRTMERLDSRRAQSGLRHVDAKDRCAKFRPKPVQCDRTRSALCANSPSDRSVAHAPAM